MMSFFVVPKEAPWIDCRLAPEAFTDCTKAVLYCKDRLVAVNFKCMAPFGVPSSPDKYLDANQLEMKAPQKLGTFKGLEVYTRTSYIIRLKDSEVKIDGVVTQLGKDGITVKHLHPNFGLIKTYTESEVVSIVPLRDEKTEKPAQ
jgi:hypothetical protein